MELMVISPWADTVWKSGEEAVISFEIKSTKPEVKLDTLTAELMSGDPLDGLSVSIIATDIPATTNHVAWTVPDFPMNSDYFVRVGSGDNWYFSHTFTIQGNGKTPLPSKPTPILEDKSVYSTSNDFYRDTVTPNKAKIESNTTSNSTKPISKSSNALKASIPGTALLLAFLSL